jgi:hypothetical protein
LSFVSRKMDWPTPANQAHNNGTFIATSAADPWLH